jgi:hypothetical protein
MQTKEQEAIDAHIHRVIKSNRESIASFERGIERLKDDIESLSVKLRCPHSHTQTNYCNSDVMYECVDCGILAYDS